MINLSEYRIPVKIAHELGGCNELLVFLYIYTNCKMAKNSWWHSYEDIATDLGMDRSHLIRYTKSLVKKGYLTIEQGSNLKNKCNVYHIKDEWMESSKPKENSEAPIEIVDNSSPLAVRLDTDRCFEQMIDRAMKVIERSQENIRRLIDDTILAWQASPNDKEIVDRVHSYMCTRYGECG